MASNVPFYVQQPIKYMVPEVGTLLPPKRDDGQLSSVSWRRSKTGGVGMNYYIFLQTGTI